MTIRDTGERGEELWGTADDPGFAELDSHIEELSDDTEIWSLVYMIGYGEDRGLFGFGDDRANVERDPVGTLNEALQSMVDNMSMTGFIKGNFKVVVKEDDDNGNV